jgi:hypothetical protein
MSLQNELDGLEMMIADGQRAVSQLESMLSDLDEKRKAAQELKAHAKEVQSKPAVIDGCGNSWIEARGDLIKAEEVLTKVGYSYGPIEEKLRRSKLYLEGLLERKKAFPLDQLREQRRIERLRARLT